MIEITTKVALQLKVCGLINIQFAIQDHKVYVIEVNPRASRTIPYISKALGISPRQNCDTSHIGQKKLSDFTSNPILPKNKFFIKTPVFLWKRFDIKDIKLGPEMKSTGEVMGIWESYGRSLCQSPNCFWL